MRDTILGLLDDRDLHIVGRRVRVLDKGTGEDIATSEGAFCVAVLAGFGGADFKDLAGLGLEYCVAAFAESGSLGRIGECGVCVAGSLGIEKSVFGQES
jgi:hypothetical protein